MYFISECTFIILNKSIFEKNSNEIGNCVIYNIYIYHNMNAIIN